MESRTADSEMQPRNSSEVEQNEGVAYPAPTDRSTTESGRDGTGRARSCVGPSLAGMVVTAEVHSWLVEWRAHLRAPWLARQASAPGAAETRPPNAKVSSMGNRPECLNASALNFASLTSKCRTPGASIAPATIWPQAAHSPNFQTLHKRPSWLATGRRKAARRD